MADSRDDVTAARLESERAERSIPQTYAESAGMAGGHITLPVAPRCRCGTLLNEPQPNCMWQKHAGPLTPVDAVPAPDMVNHPPHYGAHPSGVECIQITEWYNFNVGNAIKYLWRSDLKNGLEDLKKARWYVDREIARLEHLSGAG